MSELTIKDVMNNTPKAFNAAKAAGLSAIVQFHFTGSEASDWVVTIQDDRCEVEEGTSENPNMSMTIDSQDYLDILSGKLNAMQAFMKGKVRVKGDMNLAMKFPTLFDMK